MIDAAASHTPQFTESGFASTRIERETTLDSHRFDQTLIALGRKNLKSQITGDRFEYFPGEHLADNINLEDDPFIHPWFKQLKVVAQDVPLNGNSLEYGRRVFSLTSPDAWELIPGPLCDGTEHDVLIPNDTPKNTGHFSQNLGTMHLHPCPSDMPLNDLLHAMSASGGDLRNFLSDSSDIFLLVNCGPLSYLFLKTGATRSDYDPKQIESEIAEMVDERLFILNAISKDQQTNPDNYKLVINTLACLVNSCKKTCTQFGLAMYASSPNTLDFKRINVTNYIDVDDQTNKTIN